jgi:hypothetical protein
MAKRAPGIDRVIRSYVKGMQKRVKELEAVVRELSPHHPVLKTTRRRSKA